MERMERMSPREGDGWNVARGLLMGGADIIPGVSGGTVALILGIYPRLVLAISRCDTQLVRYVARGAWRDAARHIDLRFLVGIPAVHSQKQGGMDKHASSVSISDQTHLLSRRV